MLRVVFAVAIGIHTALNNVVLEKGMVRDTSLIRCEECGGNVT